MKYLFLITIILPCLIACGTTQTEGTKPQTPNPKSQSGGEKEGQKIQKLVQQLDDNNQKTRINATEELIKIGEPALEEVRKALVKPPNNEVRIRAKHIVSEIEFKKFKIAFASERDGNFEIYLMDVDGSNQKRLTNNNADDGSPAWSPAAEK